MDKEGLMRLYTPEMMDSVDLSLWRDAEQSACLIVRKKGKILGYIDAQFAANPMRVIFVYTKYNDEITTEFDTVKELQTFLNGL